MSLFLVTLFITLACCLAMAVGLYLRGTPLQGGCAKGVGRLGHCRDCPHRSGGESAEDEARGEE
jgi:hypothetical protein